MRIAIVTNEFPAVSETFISNKVMQLSLRGHKLFVFCSGKNDKLYTQLFGTNNNVKAILINRKALLKYLFTHPFEIRNFFLKKFEQIKNIEVKRFRLYTIHKCLPDIVHFEFSGVGISFLGELSELKARTTVSCRGSAEKVKLLADDNRKESSIALFDAVDAIHCVSADMKKTILPYVSKSEKIFINFPSVDTTLFKRTSQYLPQQVITILSVGRLTFQKGYLTGLLTVRKLKEHSVKFKWIIAGSGEQEEEIIFHIHQMQLQDEVILAGTKSRNEIIDLYNHTDIYFLPSVYEGIANVVLEAMSMELPVVCTRSGGMGEVITHGVNGFLADICDYDVLANHLSQLANNFLLRKKTGIAARERIIQEFDINCQINKFEDVYNKLLQK